MHLSALVAAIAAVAMPAAAATTTGPAVSTITLAGEGPAVAVPTVVSILQTEVADPAFFCNYYLSNGLTQSLSAVDLLSASGLTKACQYVVSNPQPGPQYDPGPSGAPCNSGFLSTLQASFIDSTSAFCKYWAASSKSTMPLAFLSSPYQVSQGCACLASSSSGPSSSTTSITTGQSRASSTTVARLSTTLATRSTSTTTTVALQTSGSSAKFNIRMNSTTAGAAHNGHYIFWSAQTPYNEYSDYMSPGVIPAGSQYLALFELDYLIDGTAWLVTKHAADPYYAMDIAYATGMDTTNEQPVMAIGTASSSTLFWTWNRSTNALSVADKQGRPVYVMAHYRGLAAPHGDYEALYFAYAPTFSNFVTYNLTVVPV
ncbi:hypothetical protein ANO11243_040790 [Dothideomycetidae sp. 11243]|nr:hypothetical protein ANO11243_040790 [fungal sp. No.11243]